MLGKSTSGSFDFNTFEAFVENDRHVLAENRIAVFILD